MNQSAFSSITTHTQFYNTQAPTAPPAPLGLTTKRPSGFAKQGYFFGRPPHPIAKPLAHPPTTMPPPFQHRAKTSGHGHKATNNRRPPQRERHQQPHSQQGQQKQGHYSPSHYKPQPVPPQSKASPTGGTAGAELLLSSHSEKQEQWWDLEASLRDAAKPKDKKKKNYKKKGGAAEPAVADRADPTNLTTSTTGPKTASVNLKEGEAVLTAAQNLFEAQRARKMDQDQKWTEKVLRQGTLSDKVAAMTLMIQEAPLFRLRTIDALLALASKSDRRCGQMAMEALKDLLEHNLLPPDRKLVAWAFQDESSLPTFSLEDPQQQARREACLAIRYFEDQLKQRVSLLVLRLEKATHDTVENFKRFAMSAVAELLQSRPEQEERLLGILVNKLGDVEKKAAPHAAHLLRRLLAAHPVMKAVVAREVQQLLHRPNLQPRGLYNGITFLDQLYLSKNDDGGLATQLVSTYFSLFDRALKAGGDLSGKMLSALLTGVNRAYPYLDASGLEGGPLAPHLEDLFRTVHQGSFKTAVQALMLLHQVVAGGGGGKKAPGVAAASSSSSSSGEGSSVEGRFYRVLYEKIKAPELLSTAHPVLFLNLLYKAMKADRDDARLAAFAKRLLSFGATQGSAALTAGVLFLLSEVMKSQPSLREALTRRASGEEGEEDAFDPSKREPSFAFGEDEAEVEGGGEDGKEKQQGGGGRRRARHICGRCRCCSCISTLPCSILRVPSCRARRSIEWLMLETRCKTFPPWRSWIDLPTKTPRWVQGKQPRRRRKDRRKKRRK